MTTGSRGSIGTTPTGSEIQSLHRPWTPDAWGITTAEGTSVSVKTLSNNLESLHPGWKRTPARCNSRTITIATTSSESSPTLMREHQRRWWGVKRGTGTSEDVIPQRFFCTMLRMDHSSRSNFQTNYRSDRKTFKSYFFWFSVRSECSLDYTFILSFVGL